MIQLKNYINGEFLEPIQNEWLDNYNPSNGSVYGHTPNSSLKDVNLAYEAAKKAFVSWSQTSLEKRSVILLKIARLIEDNLDRFAEAESKDNGKPITVAKSVDIPRAASNFRFFGHAITKVSISLEQPVILGFLDMPSLSSTVKVMKLKVKKPLTIH